MVCNLQDVKVGVSCIRFKKRLINQICVIITYREVVIVMKWRKGKKLIEHYTIASAPSPSTQRHFPDSEQINHIYIHPYKLDVQYFLQMALSEHQFYSEIADHSVYSNICYPITTHWYSIVYLPISLVINYVNHLSYMKI